MLLAMSIVFRFRERLSVGPLSDTDIDGVRTKHSNRDVWGVRVP